MLGRLNYYLPDDLFHILHRSARILDVNIDDPAALALARRSRGTPRIANRLLRRARDFAEVSGSGIVDLDMTMYALERLDVDELGLDEMDKRIMNVILEKFQGGPVGLNTLAIAVGEAADTIEEVYEPFLIQQGLLERTSRGRVATPIAYKHFEIQKKKNLSRGSLF